MKVLLGIIRIVVGLLFIFSGLIKANDPTGLAYKMEEFFEVWHMTALNPFSLSLAVIMNTFEIVAGVAVLVGWRMKLFSWLLLLLIIFFTFLTGYALLSGKIKTCGCFGDCIPLSPKQSFIKDLVLLVLILVIFLKKDIIQPIFPITVSGGLIGLTLVFCLIAQYYVLKHLPVVDCLAYKEGNNISELMKIPPGALPDSFATSFRYKKGGQEMIFKEDELPADLDDSYTFLERTQVLVRPATGVPKITDFILYSENNTDTTNPVLSQEGKYVMLMMKDAYVAETGWEEHAVKVARNCKEKGVPFYIVTATVDAARKKLPSSELITFLTCDATVIKTAARVNPTYFMMKGPVIEKKIADVDYEKVLKRI